MVRKNGGGAVLAERLGELRNALVDIRRGAALNGQQRPTVQAGSESVHTGHVPLAHNYERAAARLGVSARTVRRLVVSGELPTVRIGRSVRITEADLQRFIDTRGGRDGGSGIAGGRARSGAA
ncbi:MAG: helix-turn-helix domain-containing protein [Acidimicrobiia bacterium]|nr:helix-turn-helix domain-containing protein [Acidimicrobiia bacterium]